MYKREFDQYLSNTIPNSLLLYGENEYYINYYSKLIQKKLGSIEPLKLYFDEYDFKVAKEYLSQSSLFGDINLLIIRYDKKIPKKELDELIDISYKNGSYFIYIFEGSSTLARDLTKSFKKDKNSLFVRFFESSIKESIEILENRARELNLLIDRYVLEYLLNSLNNRLNFALNELEKLSILNREIRIEDIDSLVYSGAPLATEEIFNELFNKKDIEGLIHKLIEFGEDEIAIIKGIQRYLEQLFLFSLYFRLYGKGDSKDILGFTLPKNIFESRVKIAIKLKPFDFDRLFDILLEGEMELKKSNSTTKEVLLYSILIRLQREL